MYSTVSASACTYGTGIAADHLCRINNTSHFSRDHVSISHELLVFTSDPVGTGTGRLVLSERPIF